MCKTRQSLRMKLVVFVLSDLKTHYWAYRHRFVKVNDNQDNDNDTELHCVQSRLFYVVQFTVTTM
jgi:hypothetical protein